jgi:uncharacterized protein (TIGR03435 family)
MKKLILCGIVVAALAASLLFGQDITGTWQGTLHLPGGRDLRTVLKISRDAGALKGMFYSIDQPGAGIPASSVTVQGTTVKFAIAAIGGTYEGKLGNTDGTSITGFWSQGGAQGPGPIALDLTLANDKTAWAIPDPPAPVVPMAADATPGFEVATIKPSAPDKPGIGIGLRGRNFSTLNTPLSYLITFAYGLHPRQIVGGPAWLETEKYDLAGVPDKPGAPNDKQLKQMVQKLLADRFQLKFHREKRELSVFAITVGKGGPTLTASTNVSNGVPGLGFRGLGNLVVRNATIEDFANLMQTSVLDRPVVDQTNLKGRFDFTLDWAPDETQFGAMGVKVPPSAENETRASLFTAIQSQLGLKIDAVKAPVDVLVIDHVEKPSDN